MATTTVSAYLLEGEAGEKILGKYDMTSTLTVNKFRETDVVGTSGTYGNADYAFPQPKVAWGVPYDVLTGFGFYETPAHASLASSVSINSVEFTFKMPAISMVNTKIILDLSESDNALSADPPPTFIYHSTISTTFPSATCVGSTTTQIICTKATELKAGESYSISFKFVIAPDTDEDAI